MKRKVVFPPIESATEDGLVAIGGDLEVDTLVEAYSKGIFPWPISVDFPLAWFSPDPRGLLFLADFHVSKSFEKFLKKTKMKVSFNQAFNDVILACARMYRKDQPSTWITPDIINGYTRLFEAELAYSVEIWDEDELVGGLYGVCMGSFVSGESMFMLKDNASKLAIYALIQQLQIKSIPFLDTQMVTPIVEQFGGQYIPRVDFLNLIKDMSWVKNRDHIFK